MTVSTDFWILVNPLVNGSKTVFFTTAAWTVSRSLGNGFDVRRVFFTAVSCWPPLWCFYNYITCSLLVGGGGLRRMGGRSLAIFLMTMCECISAICNCNRVNHGRAVHTADSTGLSSSEKKAWIRVLGGGGVQPVH